MRSIAFIAMGVLGAGLLSACSDEATIVPTTPDGPGDQVFLNHLYTVLDPETFAAIGNDPFMRDVFAATQSQTIEADGGESWTGLYVRGEVSYLEFFEPSIVDEVGDSGVAFGVETPGALERLAERARTAGFVVDTDERMTEIDGELVPWFRWAAVKRTSEIYLDDWVMEYQPQFMAYTIEPAPAPDDISRKTYLAAAFRQDLLMRHVSGMRFAMPPAERDAFTRSLLAYEWKVRREGEAIVAEGPEGTTIEVVGDDTKRGLVELTIALTREPDAYSEVQLGRSTLMVGPDASAVWRFEL